MIPSTPNLSVILWCACVQIAPQRCDYIEHALEHVLEHTHRHAHRGMCHQTSGERSSGLTFHPTVLHGPRCSSLTHCCSGLSMLAEPHIPSFLLGHSAPVQGQEALSCPFPMHGFPFWAVMDCGSERGLLCALYNGVWDFSAPGFPISHMWQGSLIKASLPAMSSSFPSSGMWDTVGQIWDLHDGEIITMGRQTPGPGATPPL